MQTKLERLQKQILLNTEITAIMKQSNRLMDIVKENQEEGKIGDLDARQK